MKTRLALSVKNRLGISDKRRYRVHDLGLLFILALASGAGIKLLVNDRLTIGFDDYRLATTKNVIDLNRMQKELIQRGGTHREETAPQGKTCAE